MQSYPLSLRIRKIHFTFFVFFESKIASRGGGGGGFGGNALNFVCRFMAECLVRLPLWSGKSPPLPFRSSNTNQFQI